MVSASAATLPRTRLTRISDAPTLSIPAKTATSGRRSRLGLSRLAATTRGKEAGALKAGAPTPGALDGTTAGKAAGASGRLGDCIPFSLFGVQ